MKKSNLFASLLLSLVVSTFGYSQQKFSNCSAAFLDNKMVVNEYTDKGKCVISASAKGQLSVCTANLSPKQSLPVDKLLFKVAIRDKSTKTMVMFSNENYKQLDIQKVLAKCKKGDHIVLLTTSDEYALPHNEILVQ